MIASEATRSDRRLLDDGRATRAMRWVMAVMLFLTVLAAALGLATAGAARHWQIRGVNFDTAFRDAILGAAEVLSGNGDPGAGQPPQ